MSRSMRIIAKALTATLLASAFILAAHPVRAEDNAAPPATATRPSNPDQTSLPSSAPPASTTQTTGQTSQEPKVKQMNAEEKSKIEREGK
jgi:hypothetical protein